MLRCGFSWDQKAEQKLRKCLNLADDQQIEFNIEHYINDFLVKIYNKLSDAAKSNTLVNYTEILAFRMLSHMKDITHGSFTQARYKATFIKEKMETEAARESMTERLCCVACQSARVQFGWLDRKQRRLILKFCSTCMQNDSQKCIDMCQSDQEMKKAGVIVTNDSDLKKHFLLASYGGRKLSIKKGSKLVRNGGSAVQATPVRDDSFNYEMGADAQVIDSDPEDISDDTEEASGSGSGSNTVTTPEPVSPVPYPQPSTSSASASPDAHTMVSNALASLSGQGFSGNSSDPVVSSLMKNLDVTKAINAVNEKMGQEQIDHDLQFKMRERALDLQEKEIALKERELALQRKQMAEPAEPPAKQQRRARTPRTPKKTPETSKGATTKTTKRKYTPRKKAAQKQAEECVVVDDDN